MIWTNDPPTENGWYWYRYGKSGAFIREFYPNYKVEKNSKEQWAGPIPLPVDGKTAAKQELERLME